MNKLYSTPDFEANYTYTGNDLGAVWSAVCGFYLCLGGAGGWGAGGGGGGALERKSGV